MAQLAVWGLCTGGRCRVICPRWRGTLTGLTLEPKNIHHSQGPYIVLHGLLGHYMISMAHRCLWMFVSTCSVIPQLSCSQPPLLHSFTSPHHYYNPPLPTSRDPPSPPPPLLCLLSLLHPTLPLVYSSAFSLHSSAFHYSTLFLHLISIPFSSFLNFWQVTPVHI